MSVAARLALALVALAILAGGVVIFYVLPQLEATDTAQPAQTAPQPETVAAAVPAQPINTAPPPDTGAAQPPQTPPPADITPPPNLGPSDQAPPPYQTPPAQTPPDETPPGQPAPAEPAAPPWPVPGAPIPLAPASSAPAAPAPDQAATAAPFDPALPGVGNIAVPLNQSLPMAGTADARTEPRADAPVLVRLDKGSAVTVTAIMAGQLWLQVQLSDHQTAYIPAAALPQAVSAAGFGAAGGPAPAPGAGQPSFMADAEFLTAATRTPIYASPDPAAAVQGVLPAGTKVQIVAKSSDGQWGWLQTTDGKPAYVRMATLSAAAAPAALPDMITGRVKVLTTASLIVDGHRIGLYGVKGMGGTYASQMRALIDSRGGVLTCARRDALYVCSLPGNIDIARAALYNGGARPADDASPDYREQADAARAARRGVWAR